MGRLSGTKGTVWQYTAIDVASPFAWAQPRTSERNPRARHTREPAHRAAREPAQPGRKPRQVGTDNGSQFRPPEFRRAVAALDARQRLIKAGRPNSNGRVERPQPTILKQCWRRALAPALAPKTTAPQRDLDQHLTDHNLDPAHTGRPTKRSIPADIAYGARKTRPPRRAPTVATSRG